MSTARTPGGTGGTPSVLARLSAGGTTFAIGLLFVVELVVLSIAFDSAAMHATRPAIAWMLDAAPVVAHVGLVSLLFAGLLTGPSRWAGSWASLVEAAARHRTRPAWLGAHLATFAGIVALVSQCVERELLAGPYDIAWLATGCLLGVAAIVTAAGLLAPPAFWGDVFVGHRWTLAAAVILGLVTRALGVLTGTLWNDLAGATLTAVTWLLQAASFDVEVDAARRIIGTSSFRVHIAPGCSGYEGLGLGLAFVGVFLVLLRDRLRFPNALLLIPLCIAAMLTSNVLRIAGLIAIGTTLSPELALGGFHSQAGWLAFNLVAVGTVVVGLGVPWFQRRDVVESTTEGPLSNGTAVHLAPLMALLAAGMFLQAFTESEIVVQAGKILVGLIALGICRSAIPTIRRSEWPMAVVVGLLVFATWSLLGAWEAGKTTAVRPLDDPVWIVLRLIGSVLVVPVVEELAFRGYLMRRLVSVEFEDVEYRDVQLLPVVLSSLAFGLVHGWWVAGTVAGAIFGLLARHRGLGAAIVAHAVANAAVATAALLGGQHWLW